MGIGVVESQHRGHCFEDGEVIHETARGEIPRAIILSQEVAHGGTNEAAHIVGNSAGGYVSQQLAIQHPGRVMTLALYGSTPGLKNSHALTWLPLVKEPGPSKRSSSFEGKAGT